MLLPLLMAVVDVEVFLVVIELIVGCSRRSSSGISVAIG